MALSPPGTAVDKEGFVGLRRVNGQGNVLGRVGAQTAGILVAVVAHLAERKPDAPVAVVSGKWAHVGIRLLPNFSIWV